MIRIRFHGRGGQGVKTASRILGTAAFLAGFQCQDSPVYGAERRGAAVTAYNRIGRHPIRERGMITLPDLILVADETLLADDTAFVLQGQRQASAVFVNALAGNTLASQFAIQPTVLTLDLTSRTREPLGRASALSAGLAAAATRMVGHISLKLLLEAVREELHHPGITAENIDKNVQLAQSVFEQLQAGTLQGGTLQGGTLQGGTLQGGRAESPERIVRVDYCDALSGAPSVLNTGNACLRNTGAWRVERPVIDPAVCTRCGLCLVVCPDGAISLDEHGYPVIDYDHCKGCMICRQRCPLNAISREEETRAW